MVLKLSDEVELLRRTVRAAVDDRLEALAEEADRTHDFSPEILAIVRDLGLPGIAYPTEVGGGGGSFVSYVVAMEELARGAALAVTYCGTSVQVGRTILKVGTSEQISRWVPPLARGEILGAWAFTEPQTGTDPRQIETRAIPDGSDWVINGQKMFISFASQAAVAIVFAKVPSGRIGAFLVDTSSEGWKPGRQIHLFAKGGSGIAPVYLEDLRVPESAVLGDLEDGFSVMVANESEGKLRGSAICTGVAQRALDVATRYAMERTHRGAPIGRKFQTIQWLLGDMASAVMAVRAFLYAVADDVDEGHSVVGSAAALKLAAGRAAREVTSNAIQVCGAYGLTTDLPVERLYREGKMFEVTQGAAEIQRVIVARELMNEYERA